MFAPLQKILKIVENTYFLVKLTLKGGSGLLQSILLSNTSLLALRLPQNQILKSATGRSNNSEDLASVTIEEVMA